MIEANLRLVVHVAKRYRRDREGEGACRSSTSSRRGRSGSSAPRRSSTTARASSSRPTRRGGSASRSPARSPTRAAPCACPVHVVDQVNKISRTERDLSLKLGRDVSNEEIADVLGFPPSRSRTCAARRARPCRSTRRSATRRTPSSATCSPTQLALARGRRRGDDARAGRPRGARAALQLERRVLQLRFGLFGEQAHTLPAIGKQLGITANRARLLETAALDRLQRLPEGQALREAA
jgi:hypothetical protein